LLVFEQEIKTTKDKKEEEIWQLLSGSYPCDDDVEFVVPSNLPLALKEKGGCEQRSKKKRFTGTFSISSCQSVESGC
jgi:hypothetical protein